MTLLLIHPQVMALFIWLHQNISERLAAARINSSLYEEPENNVCRAVWASMLLWRYPDLLKPLSTACETFALFVLTRQPIAARVLGTLLILCLTMKCWQALLINQFFFIYLQEVKGFRSFISKQDHTIYNTISWVPPIEFQFKWRGCHVTQGTASTKIRPFLPYCIACIPISRRYFASIRARLTYTFFGTLPRRRNYSTMFSVSTFWIGAVPGSGTQHHQHRQHIASLLQLQLRSRSRRRYPVVTDRERDSTYSRNCRYAARGLG